MNRQEFEHVLGAAANVLGEGDFVVIGSQAILGSYPNAPAELLRSTEVDMYPLTDPERAIEVDGAIGDGSSFQQAYGYYAHGIGPETATPPEGWEGRLVEVQLEPRPGSDIVPTAWCMEPHDLVLAKCAAGRERDWEFCGVALGAGLVEIGTLVKRAATLPLPPEARSRILKHLEGLEARREGR